MSSDAGRPRATVVRVLLAALLTTAGLSVGPVAASADTCDTSWAAPVSGNWNDAGNWTAGVPGGSQSACITADGTYTVSIVARAGNHASTGGVPGELTLGGTSGTQTIAVTGTEVDALTFPASLSVGGGTVDSHGAIVFSSTVAGVESSFCGGDPGLVNQGTISFEAGGGGVRVMQGTVKNEGIFDVDADTSIPDGASCGENGLTNAGGTVDVASGRTLTDAESYEQSAGATTVNGALTTSQPVLLQGGSLDGAGVVTASSVDNAGGTVHPGSSPGILTIAGNYTQGPTGRLATDIAGAEPGSGYSRLAVSGNATIAGTLDVTNGFTPASGQAFKVLTTGGTRSGTFSSTVVHGEPRYDVLYDPADVTLVAPEVLVPPASPAGAGLPTPHIGRAVPGSRRLTCRRGLKKRRIKGKPKCVKIKRKKKRHRR